MQYQIEIYNKMFDCAQPTAITLDSRHVEMENQFLQPESSIPRKKVFLFNSTFREDKIDKGWKCELE
jgi:hypothetical protein